MTPNLIGSFPAAGAGGVTLEQLQRIAARRGAAYVALSNPASIEAFLSGDWEKDTTEQLRRAMDEASATRVVLVGHCMGGLSAIRLAGGLDRTLGCPVAVLAVNTPCPDSSGRIKTMSRLSDAEIAAVLAHDGFPQDILDDEDMLAEVADGLREDATIGDRLAEAVSSAGSLDSLHVLATRGDIFIPPEECVGWRHRVSGEFHLTIAPGGHTLDEAAAGVFEGALAAAVAGLERR
jgi:surfactin synthase thioesterase subunit